MIVGTLHLENPGLDGHNLKVDDVLAPKRQAQIAALIDGLARFKPTKVAAEWSAKMATEQYAAYLGGTLPPSRNEVVQFGFRLAKQSGHTGFYGVDVPGPFPFGPVDDYARAHGQGAMLDEADGEIEASVQKTGELLMGQGLAAALRYLNDPARITREQGVYRVLGRIGGGSEQPGAELLTAWYRRNFLICANIVQLSQPGDRIVVFYGSGHAFLLRQCVSETPGFKLVEPNAFLPK
jgi:hypothetical protein